MHFANCAALAAILFTSFTESLRLCSSAEAGIVFNFFLNFEQKPGCRTILNNGSGSGFAPAQNILAVQVWFGFT